MTPDSRWKVRDLLSCKCEAPKLPSSDWCCRLQSHGSLAVLEKGADWFETLWRSSQILYMPGREIVYQWSSKGGGRLRQRREKERFLQEALGSECLRWLGSLLLFTEFQRWPIHKRAKKNEIHHRHWRVSVIYLIYLLICCWISKKSNKQTKSMG